MNEVSVSDGNVMTRSSQTEMMISRQAQEVQAAMVIAKKFPRDDQENVPEVNPCRAGNLFLSTRWSECQRTVYPTCGSISTELGQY